MSSTLSCLSSSDPRQKPICPHSIRYTREVEARGRAKHRRNSCRQSQSQSKQVLVSETVGSLDLEVRPISKRTQSGYLQVGVETYGGGIWHSWLDRDLSLAGRIVIAEQGGGFSSKLIKIDRPLLRIPTLAIHRKSYF